MTGTNAETDTSKVTAAINLRTERDNILFSMLSSSSTNSIVGRPLRDAIFITYVCLFCFSFYSLFYIEYPISFQVY